MMAIQQELHELLMILSDCEMPHEQAIRVEQQMLLAIDDPEAYVASHPDEEWLVEGCDLQTNQAASRRLLHWTLRHGLAEWIVMHDKLDALVMRVIDRLSEQGVVVADPTCQLATLSACRKYLVDGLSALQQAALGKTVIQIELAGASGLMIVSAAQVATLKKLAAQIGLRIDVGG